MTATTSSHRSARERAVKALVQSYDGLIRGRDVLDRMQAEGPLSVVDAALASELVSGVLRHRITLEHICAQFYRGRWEGLRPAVRMILAVAAYQLCWLDRIPPHAAVNEAVKHARRHGKGAAGVVNAVLRQITECRGDVSAYSTDVDPRRWLVLDAERGRRFEQDLFPDPARRPLDYLVTATSHPMYLVERWHRRFKPAGCRQICDAGRSRPPLVLRVNTMRTRAEALTARLEAAGHRCVRVSDPDAVVLPDHPSIADTPEFAEGLCQPQDLTSQRALLLAPPASDEFVLDFCAGVGTKATQAAERMGNRGLIVAADVDASRLERIPENAARLGISIVQTCPSQDLPATLARIGRKPELIVVDAPCTNTGVLSRRLEARYRASHRHLQEMAALQKELLGQAAEIAGPRTRIIYATCSIEREENEDVIDEFVGRHDGWQVVKQEFVLPDVTCGGGFAALLMRDSA